MQFVARILVAVITLFCLRSIVPRVLLIIPRSFDELTKTAQCNSSKHLFNFLLRLWDITWTNNMAVEKYIFRENIKNVGKR